MLLQSRVGPAVGVYQAVHAEIAVMGILAVVSSIVVHLLALYGAPLVDGVVAPLPDHSAAGAVIGLEYLEIVLQVPRAVTHGVAVFALEEGTL